MQPKQYMLPGAFQEIDMMYLYTRTEMVHEF